MLRPEQNKIVVEGEVRIIALLTDRPHVANSLLNSFVKSYGLVSTSYQHKNLPGIHDSANTHCEGLYSSIR